MLGPFSRRPLHILVSGLFGLWASVGAQAIINYYVISSKHAKIIISCLPVTATVLSCAINADDDDDDAYNGASAPPNGPPRSESLHYPDSSTEHPQHRPHRSSQHPPPVCQLPPQSPFSPVPLIVPSSHSPPRNRHAWKIPPNNPQTCNQSQNPPCVRLSVKFRKIGSSGGIRRGPTARMPRNCSLTYQQPR